MCSKTKGLSLLHGGNLNIPGGMVTVLAGAELIVDGNTKLYISSNNKLNNHGVFETRNLTVDAGIYSQSEADAKLIIHGNTDFDITTQCNITGGTVVFDGTEQQTINNLKAYNVEVLNPAGVKYLSNVQIYGNYDLHGNPLEFGSYKTVFHENGACVNL